MIKFTIEKNNKAVCLLIKQEDLFNKKYINSLWEKSVIALLTEVTGIKPPKSKLALSAKKELDRRHK